MARLNLESQLLFQVLSRLGSLPDVLAYRVNVVRMGRVLSAPVGHPDVVVVYHGRAIYLELKSPTGRQSGPQAGFQRGVERAGGVYRVCRTMPEVEKALADVVSPGV